MRKPMASQPEVFRNLHIPQSCRVKPIVKANQPLKKNKKGPGTWYTNSMRRENRKTLLLSQMTKLCVAKFQS